MEIECWIRSHEHRLRLREDAIDDQFTCQICNSRVKGAPFYWCDSCTGFRVHKSCAELPYKILHPLHPHSPLFLHPVNLTRCNNCFGSYKHAQLYSCGACNVNMDEKCALMPLPTLGREGRDWIRSIDHVHPLLRVDYDDDRQVKCLVCNSTNHRDHLYGCSECQYFLHKSCMELPKEIHLPLHCNHRATLQQLQRLKYVCGMCKILQKGKYNLAYSCDQCSLMLCFKCTEVAWTSSGSFKYEDHDHLLCLVENVKDNTTASSLSPCDCYDSCCTQHIDPSSDEFKKIESFMLWCYQCGFRVHLLCAPLPSMVKYEFHIHSLALVDSMREDDSGEYYCDVCETKRDPLIRLYCCRECKYFAHVHCIIPEIAKLLSRDLKDVELKTVGQDLWNMPGCELKIDHVDSALTLKDVINELSKDEKESIRLFYKWDETSSEDKNWKLEDHENIESQKSFKVGDEEIDEILRLSRFTYGDFRSFLSNLHDYYFRNKVELKPSDLALKMVMVKGYMIPPSLATVLNKLLHGYGDIDIAFMSRSLGFKSFVFFIACKVIKTMHTTMPMRITKSLLQEWYYHLQFAADNNFKVDFAHEQLKELIHAFFGFQAERLEEEIPATLTKKISGLQQKLNKCNEIRESSLKSEYMKYCSKKASEFKWKLNAFGGSMDE